MANNLSILFFFSTCLLFFFFCPLLHLVSTCSAQFCKPCEPGIQYPFRLKPIQPYERCGYPGFDLSCNGQNQTTLSLPLSGEFIVDSIDYGQRVIQIRDPDDCLPKRLHNFTTSGSIWTVKNHTKFSFLKCPMESRALDMFPRVPCLDGHNYRVVVVATDELGIHMVQLRKEFRCHLSQNVSTPTSNFTPHGTGRMRYLSSIDLTWDEPPCIIWGAFGDPDAGCTIPPPYKGSPKGDTTDQIVLGICVPFSVCLLCLIACKLRAHCLARQEQTDPSSPLGRAQALVIVSGMDTPTIESYPETRVGDAGGLMPQDNSCSICLSEYKLKEVLRTLPECKHSFHAHCIDSWLKRNACCPLCRNDQGYAMFPTFSLFCGKIFFYTIVFVRMWCSVTVLVLLQAAD
ncbi:hypothetical protein BT93_D2057 [Corymbia citriodora subsp. variegata]|nr:hypothetical protein BT93_D2057 [Corymbia citriodora subsp. variegata]